MLGPGEVLIPGSIDFRGERYSGPVSAGLIELKTQKYDNNYQIFYQNVRDRGELLEAMKYGQYLESIGYEFMISSQDDTLVYKLIWYLDPAYHLLGIKKESDRPAGMEERTFAIRFGRNITGDSWRDEIRSWSKRAEPIFTEFKDMVNRAIRGIKC